MARENKRPKAFSHIKSPADKNAFHKKPIIRMDPGTLHGNIVTSASHDGIYRRHPMCKIELSFSV